MRKLIFIVICFSAAVAGYYFYTKKNPTAGTRFIEEQVYEAKKMFRDVKTPELEVDRNTKIVGASQVFDNIDQKKNTENKADKVLDQ